MRTDAVPQTQFNYYVEHAARDPHWFAGQIGVVLDDWQSEMTHAVADVWRRAFGWETYKNHEGLSRFTVRSGHGSGKTYWIAWMMHLFAFIFRGRSPVLAPKLDQVKGRIFGAFADILAGAPDWYKSTIDQQALRIYFKLDKQWYYEAVAAAKPENAQGYHDMFMFIPVEEASGVREDLFPVIDGAMSTGKIVILCYISNPTRTQGTFYDSHRKSGVRDMFYRYHVRAEQIQRPGFQAWLQQLAIKYGTSSPVYKVRGLGEFADLAANQLIALEWLQMARDTDFESKYDGSLPRKRISVDCADGGDDRTVTTLAEHYATFLRGLKQRAHDFPMYEAPTLTGKAVADLWDQYDCDGAAGDDVVVDYIGPGTGVVTWLMTNRPDIPVIAYKGGSASDDNKEWDNRRTQSYCVARNSLRDNTVVLNDDFCESGTDWTDFEAQLCSIRTKPGTEAKETLMTKKEMKQKNIKSPDQADSWVMQYATAQPVLVGAGTFGAFGGTAASQFDDMSILH